MLLANKMGLIGAVTYSILLYIEITEYPDTPENPDLIYESEMRICQEHQLFRDDYCCFLGIVQ